MRFGYTPKWRPKAIKKHLNLRFAQESKNVPKYRSRDSPKRPQKQEKIGSNFDLVFDITLDTKLEQRPLQNLVSAAAADLTWIGVTPL